MAGYVELFIDQGADFNNTIFLSDDISNQSVNISGYTVRSQMRRSYYSANATAEITCAITDFANGEIAMSLTSGQTANIKAGRYLFDVETVTGGGIVNRILEGIITISPQITR